MTAFRTLWTALVSLYEETLTLLAANLAALALNLPLGLLVVLIAILAPNFQDDVARQWLLGIVLWLMLYVPTPGNIALAGVTRVAAGPDVPRLGLFRAALRAHWRLALQCCVLSVVVMAALRDCVDRYIFVTMTQLMRNSGCNRFHVVLQRVARRLLMTADRAHASTFRLTHGMQPRRRCGRRSR